MRTRPLFALVAIAMVLVACGDDKVVGAGDDRALTIVQDGNFNGHPEYTIGEAAFCFFDNPKWSSLTGTDGSTYVNLTGGMTYLDEPAVAEIQFRVDKDAATFVLNAFEIDGVAKNNAMILALIAAMYGEDGCG